MDYSTIIDTFVISEMNAKAKLEAKSKQSRVAANNSPPSIPTSTSSPVANKARCMSDQRSLLRTRLEHEASDQSRKSKALEDPPHVPYRQWHRLQSPFVTPLEAKGNAPSVPSPLPKRTLEIQQQQQQVLDATKII